MLVICDLHEPLGGFDGPEVEGFEPGFFFGFLGKNTVDFWVAFAGEVATLGLEKKLIAVFLGLLILAGGFALGTALAFLLGTMVALSRRFEYYLYPFIVMFQALPKVALAPLIVVWFGLGLSSKVMNAALIAFFPLMVNTILGLRSADEDRVNLMRSLDASETQIFWMLRLPGALPFIMAGLEVAMIFSLIGAIVAEFVGAQSGLGVLIQSLNFSADIAGVFSVLLILAVLGLILNQAILLVRRRVLFWDPSEKRSPENPARRGRL